MTTKYAIIYEEYAFGDGAFVDTIKECKEWAAAKQKEIVEDIAKPYGTPGKIYPDGFSKGYIPYFIIKRIVYNEKTTVPVFGDYDGSKFVSFVPIEQPETFVICSGLSIKHILELEE